jgi:acyl dehydratase
VTNTSQLYFEDFHPGQVYPGAASEASLAAFHDFARLTGDAHPIHYDEGYAAKTRFGKPIAHGLLLAAFTALGATPLSGRVEESMVAMLETSFRYKAPVFVGDALRSEFEVLETRRSEGRSEGVVRLAVRLLRPDGTPVLEGHHAYLVRLRVPA